MLSQKKMRILLIFSALGFSFQNYELRTGSFQEWAEDSFERAKEFIKTPIGATCAIGGTVVVVGGVIAAYWFLGRKNNLPTSTSGIASSDVALTQGSTEENNESQSSEIPPYSALPQIDITKLPAVNESLLGEDKIGWFSDHVGVIVKIPVQFGKDQELRILSCNVAAPAVIKRDLEDIAKTLGIETRDDKFKGIADRYAMQHEQDIASFLHQASQFNVHVSCTQEDPNISVGANRNSGWRAFYAKKNGGSYGEVAYTASRSIAKEIRFLGTNGSNASSVAMEFTGLRLLVINAHLSWQGDRNSTDVIQKELAVGGQNYAVMQAIDVARKSGMGIVLVGDSNLDPRLHPKGIKEFKNKTQLNSYAAVGKVTSVSCTGDQEDVDHVWWDDSAKVLFQGKQPTIKALQGSNPTAVSAWMWHVLRTEYPELKIPEFKDLTPKDLQHIKDNSRFNRPRGSKPKVLEFKAAA